MISFEQAQEKLQALGLAQRKFLESIQVGLDQAFAQVSHKDIYAKRPHPAFDNSSMDGFAVRVEDLHIASSKNPIVLPIIGESSAGKPFNSKLEPQQACRIMTGAKVPAGADGVIKLEDVVEKNGRISISQPIPLNHNIRKKGEDLKAGQQLVPKGSVLTAEDIMLLASQGEKSVPVVSPIKVSIISTGMEIRSQHDAMPEPTRGEIHNSTAPFLKSKIKQLPCELVFQESCSDDATSLFAAFSHACKLGSDIIISTGGVSAGKYDLIPRVISDLKASTIFHKVLMKPGKPLLLASVPGRKPTTFFGLPGNPISTLVGFNFFVEPYIKQLLSQPRYQPIKVIANHEFSTPKSLSTFLRAKVRFSPQASLVADLCEGQGSHMLASLREYNAWIKVEEGKEVIAKGTLVDAYLLGQDRRSLF